MSYLNYVCDESSSQTKQLSRRMARIRGGGGTDGPTDPSNPDTDGMACLMDEMRTEDGLGTSTQEKPGR